MFNKVLFFISLLPFRSILLQASTQKWDPSSDPVYYEEFDLEWCPKNDPIYDSRDGKCYYEDFPNCKFSVDEIIGTSRAIERKSSRFSSQPSSASNNPKRFPTALFIETGSSGSSETENEPYSWDSNECFQPFNHFFPKSTSFGLLEPQKISRRSRFYYYGGTPLVPKSCLKYKRMWEFYHGLPEGNNNNLPFGWISRLAYASDMIFKMGLPYEGQSFTLLYADFMDINTLHGLLQKSFCFEFQIPSINLFSHLHEISDLTDKIYRYQILAIVFTLDNEKNVTMKILCEESLPGLHIALSKLVHSLPAAQPYYKSK